MIKIYISPVNYVLFLYIISITSTSFHSNHTPDKLIEFNKILKRENSIDSDH